MQLQLQHVSSNAISSVVQTASIGVTGRSCQSVFVANALAAAGAFIHRTWTQTASLRSLKRSFSHRM